METILSLFLECAFRHGAIWGVPTLDTALTTSSWMPRFSATQKPETNIRLNSSLAKDRARRRSVNLYNGTHKLRNLKFGTFWNINPMISEKRVYGVESKEIPFRNGIIQPSLTSRASGKLGANRSPPASLQFEGEKPVFIFFYNSWMKKAILIIECASSTMKQKHAEIMAGSIVDPLPDKYSKIMHWKSRLPTPNSNSEHYSNLIMKEAASKLWMRGYR